jgi:3-oxoacyl-[acyl-carrier protein] reductase
MNAGMTFPGCLRSGAPVYRQSISHGIAGEHMEQKPVVLITGASRGIGKSIALEFGKNDYTVIINFLKEKEKALAVAQTIVMNGGRARAVAADVSDSAAVRTLVSDIEANESRLDVLVNNAGLTKNRSLVKMSDDEWEKIIATDLSGPFYVIRECAQLMARIKGGSIINMGSILGFRGAFGSANYAGAKAGLVGLTKSTAIELGRFNVRVNMVLPGFHLTDMGAGASDKYIEKARLDSVLGVTTDLDEFARFVVFLSQTKTVSGQVFNFDSRIL